MGRRKFSDDDLACMERAMTAKLIDAWHEATHEQREAGKGWYYVAHEEAKLLAREIDVPVRRAAAIIAVLSPRTRWLGNVEDAWALVSGDPIRHSLPANVRKARRLLAGEPISHVLGGRKVRSFWSNIADPARSRASTQDSWMGKLFGVGDMLFNVYGVYDAADRATEVAARVLGVQKHQVQAVAWVVVRDKWTRGSELPNPYEKG